MKRTVLFFLLFSLLFAACSSASAATAPTATTQATRPTEAVPTTAATLPPTVATAAPTEAPARPLHSELYIEGISAEDIVTYFNEICLYAEFVNSGDPSKLQKWEEPIYYILHGAYTQEDYYVISDFTAWLNTIEGFPGMWQTKDAAKANLNIYFGDANVMTSLLGSNFAGMDGGVTFWYEDDIINQGIICYRTDVDQYLRNSVLLEEIYNGLGPVDDTWAREDSIVFAGFSTPQQLTQVDEVILKLLYHPSLQCGMDAAACEAAIRQLYY